MLNCRFPTRDEWTAATTVKPMATAAPNLRDVRWLRQHQHMQQINKGRDNPVVPLWPDAGVFWPAAFAERKTGAAAQPVVATDDGYLWFAPVDLGNQKGFQHLVGNVAEFIFDDPHAAVGLGVTSGALSSSAAAKFLAQHPGKLGVIGASALSPPQLWDGTGKPFTTVYPVDLSRASGAAVDVGFRLAFTAPETPPSLRLKRLLADPPFILSAER
jgi:hypothetical protein